MPAKATITNAKTLPNENPKIALATMNPRAAKPPMASIGPRNEKSVRVMNTVIVIPRKSPMVVIPAFRRTVESPDTDVEIRISGTKITASATIKNNNPKY